MQLLSREKCPICEADSSVVGKVCTINPSADETVQLRQCSVCGHWWNSPVPSQEDLISMYAESSPYVVGAGAGESYRTKSHLDTFQQGVLDHGASVSPCNYLEIGAGGGLLLRRFRELGFRCHGVDPAQWVDDDSIVSDLADVPQDIRFGVIVLADVLEHLVDPLGMMEKLHGLADRGASLFCSFPCKDSRPARKYKGRWSMVRPFGHIHYFSPESARMMFTRTGWQIVNLQRARIIPVKTILARCDVRTLAYEIVKGGRDQMYVTASAGQSPAN